LGVFDEKISIFQFLSPCPGADIARFSSPGKQAPIAGPVC
jgi:hypothetical protein